MLNFLFPTPIYIEQDLGFVDIGNKWFNKARYYTGPLAIEKFRTTLVTESYSPRGAGVTFDCSQEPEWVGWSQFVTYHVSQFIKERKLKPYTVSLVNTWLNEVKSGGGQSRHSHYGYTVSGVYYTQVPEGSGQLMFHNDQVPIQHFLSQIEEDTPFNCPDWWIPVETGTIVLFPSHTTHSVPVLEFDGIRRSIAFDVTLRWEG